MQPVIYSLIAIILGSLVVMIMAATYIANKTKKEVYRTDLAGQQQSPSPESGDVKYFVTNRAASGEARSKEIVERHSQKDGMDSHRTVKPTEKTLAFIDKNLGRACQIIGTQHKGIVLGMNVNLYSVCPASDYPILVKITESPLTHLIDRVLEYKIDSLIILE